MREILSHNTDWKYTRIHACATGLQVNKYIDKEINRNLNLNYQTTQSHTYIAILEVDLVGKFSGHLIEGTSTPVPKPVQHTSVEQSRRCGRSVLQSLGGRVHSEYYMQIVDNLRGRTTYYDVMIANHNIIESVYRKKSKY